MHASLIILTAVLGVAFGGPVNGDQVPKVWDALAKLRGKGALTAEQIQALYPNAVSVCDWWFNVDCTQSKSLAKSKYRSRKQNPLAQILTHSNNRLSLATSNMHLVVTSENRIVVTSNLCRSFVPAKDIIELIVMTLMAYQKKTSNSVMGCRVPRGSGGSGVRFMPGKIIQKRTPLPPLPRDITVAHVVGAVRWFEFQFNQTFQTTGDIMSLNVSFSLAAIGSGRDLVEAPAETWSRLRQRPGRDSGRDLVEVPVETWSRFRQRPGRGSGRDLVEVPAETWLYLRSSRKVYGNCHGWCS
ncbi:hypothetical protein BV898_14032 [Hypsibius exemplaris]|uniref:Uncharacterized protein n=1 Tax=Hypsibius exemplaris TaxID=2072580 RepID=A0A1W0W949_HYPEX|nr:hypothetical protein BV898_14032 [Hypsibius exemplaris]